VRDFGRRFAGSFVQGLVALAPLVITGYVLAFFIGIVERRLDIVLVLVPEAYRTWLWVVLCAELLTAAVLIVLVAGLGVVVKTIVGKAAIKGLDSLLHRVPGLSTVHVATRQVLELFVTRRRSFLMRPVLVEYPSQGIWSLAFNTGEAPVVLTGNACGQFYTVFIPTTPNPTSGFLILMPADRIRPVDLTAEEAIKVILTGGILKS
jgi:uncharacterized membrane protein